MINKNDIKIIENIQEYVYSSEDIKTIAENTVNTWQEKRSNVSKEEDTKMGKMAEDIFSAYIKHNMRNLTYLSYDDIRTNNFKKHAPFDGLIFNNTSIDMENLIKIIIEINDEITNDKWGKISDDLKIKCQKNHIYIVEIKSTRVTDRHKINSKVNLDIFLKDDFLEYPKYLRTDKYDTINGFMEYVNFCKKYRDFVCSTDDCIADIKHEEKNNMRHLYARVYIDEQENIAYIIGCISNRTFINNAIIKKMPQWQKSELALYLATSLSNGVSIDKISEIK